MVVINKIIGTMLSPIGLALAALLLSGAWSMWKKSGKACVITAFICVAWLWVWSMGAFSCMLGVPLERAWTQVRAEDLPSADAIVVLGGGMSAVPEVYPYPDMHGAADRVWHAARLYKAGKAPIVMPTGLNDKDAVVPLLLDFGIPADAIVGEYEARNTEENAKFVSKKLAELRKARGEDPNKRAKVLLVTSAWHMRRSLLMYQKYAKDMDIIPAPADFENTVARGTHLENNDWFPAAEALVRNSYIVKEIIGYWGYRLLR